MPTKAQEFRTRQQRTAKPPKPKQPRRPRRDTVVDTSLPGVSASDRKVGLGGTAEGNRSARAGRKGGAKLESSQSGRPSRKSTRKSAGRVKRTTNQQLKAIRASNAPTRRATRP